MTPASPQPSTGSRVAASAAKGGCLLGLIGFACGFFGPMIFTAEANQDPMLGILITGPAGLVLGLLIGAVVGWSRRNEVVPQASGMPKHRQFWLWLKTGEDGTAVSFLLLITGIPLGAMLAIWLMIEAVRSKNGTELQQPLLVITASAFAWGFIGGLIQPKQAPLWSMGIMLLLLMAPIAALNGLGGVATGCLRR